MCTQVLYKLECRYQVYKELKQNYNAQFSFKAYVLTKSYKKT